MGIETEELRVKEPIFRYIIRQLFNQKVILAIIGAVVAISSVVGLYLQNKNSNVQDDMKMATDTVKAKQEVTQKVDSNYRIEQRKYRAEMKEINFFICFLFLG